MKRFVLACIVSMLMVASTGFAAPSLVSDPTPATDEVINFKIFFDGSLTAIDSAPDATKAIKYDLGGIASGAHTVKAQACNAAYCSVDSLPFNFTKVIPGVPQNQRITNNQYYETNAAPVNDVVTSYKLSVDGGAWITVTPVAGAIKYNISGLANGTHTIKSQVCNIWGCSIDSVPLAFNKQSIPSATGNLRIQ